MARLVVCAFKLMVWVFQGWRIGVLRFDSSGRRARLGRAGSPVAVLRRHQVGCEELAFCRGVKPELGGQHKEGVAALEKGGVAFETGSGHTCGDQEGVVTLGTGAFALKIGVLWLASLESGLLRMACLGWVRGAVELTVAPVERSG